MYYVLSQSPKPKRWLADVAYLKGINLRRGQIITSVVPDPVEVVLKPLNVNNWEHSSDMPPIFNFNYPIWRDDFIAALNSAGVDNLQCFNVAMSDPDNGQVYTNYKAVCVVGLVAAADMAKSEFTVHPGGPALIDVDFDKLVIDESKTHQLLMFRLAESNNAILVHESVRDYLIKTGFKDIDHLAFHKPETVAL